MNSYTKAGLAQFLDIAVDKGLVNTNTGNAWKAAVNKILSDVSDDDDVQNYDVHEAVLRFNNRFPGELSGESLKKYEQRAGAAIEQFIAWKSDPLNYRGPSRGLTTNGKSADSRKVIRRARPTAAGTEPKVVKTEVGLIQLTGHPPVVNVGMAQESGLVIPFPLRSNFVAQFHIPRNLSTEEAKRLSVFILALGHDIGLSGAQT